MDQLALFEILTPTQPGATHAATLEHMGESAFGHLAALAQGVPPDAGFQLRPISCRQSDVPPRRHASKDSPWWALVLMNNDKDVTEMTA